MNILSIKLPETLDSQLTAVARRMSSSKSSIMREALKEYLSRREVSSPTSFATLAKDFKGCIDGGPSDLSSNRKHMKGFGK